MTEAWNADQAHREERPATQRDRWLVIVEPNELETPPGWINDPPGLIERLLAGYFKLAVQLNRIITQPFKRGVLGAEYAKNGAISKKRRP